MCVIVGMCGVWVKYVRLREVLPPCQNSHSLHLPFVLNASDRHT